MIPVVSEVPAAAQRLRGRDRVEDLRRRAAEAVRRSAELIGAAGFEARTDGDGRPRPHGGLFWSRAHSRRFVAGVVSEGPVGIDVEGPRVLTGGAAGLLRVRVDAVRSSVGEGPGPAGLDGADALLRWVVLEACSKCFGLGLSGASRVAITQVADGIRAACSGQVARVWFRHQPPLWLALAGLGGAEPGDIVWHGPKETTA